METRSIQQSGRYFPKTVEKPERLCSSLNLAYRESSEKSSNRHGYNNSNTPAWQTQAEYPKALQISIRNPLLIPRTDELLLNPVAQKTPSCDKQNTEINGLGSFREKISSQWKGTINHESSWRKWNSCGCEQVLDPCQCNINPVFKQSF